MSDFTGTTTSLGRLGAWAADHRRLVVIVWATAVLALGALAPFADKALSGAGWETPGAESGKARKAIDTHFPGQGTYALSVVIADRDGPPTRATLERVDALLRADGAVRGVTPPRASRDGSTAIVTGLA